MKRETIQVPSEIKKSIQEIRDREGLKTEWQAIKLLLEIEKDFDSTEIYAFLRLRKAMFKSFQDNRHMSIDDF